MQKEYFRTRTRSCFLKHTTTLDIPTIMAYNDDEFAAFIEEMEEDEDEDEEDDSYLVMLNVLYLRLKDKRSIKYKHNRINWNEHVEMLHHTGEFEFQRRYHMTEESFNKLVEMLREDLMIDIVQSMRASGGNPPILPELVVACGLRSLGGVKRTEVADIFGMSITSAHRILHKFLDTVSRSPQLAIKIPTTPEELKKCADDWNELSGAFGLYYGAVGAIDGWLACMNSPRVTDASNQTDFFSGHYQRYGLNIQAVCDANLRFIYFAVASPGKTNDLRAFGRCEKLQRWLHNLPNEYFLVGDNAYTLSNDMLVPFSGSQKQNEYNRSYNFYLSQLRIRIEMAFGRLTSKWRIFRKNLDYSLETNSKICVVAARLHNYVIDNDRLDFRTSPDSNTSMQISEFGVESLPDGPENNIGYLPSNTDEDQGGVESSDRRNGILVGIRQRQLLRPEHNLLRNGDVDI